MAERRARDINASSAAKPNFGKRRLVHTLADIWMDLTCAEPSSTPDSRFAEFIYASWNSLIVEAPEQSFDNAIREVVRQRKQAKSTT